MAMDDEKKFNYGAIGRKIGLTIHLFQAVLRITELSADELKAFDSYLDLQASVGWVFDPTGWRDASQRGQFDDAKDRVEAIQAVQALPVNDARPDLVEALKNDLARRNIRLD